jgi:hypothetical protein
MEVIMNLTVSRFDIPAFDPVSYDAAVCTATTRAAHSFFDQHVIDDEDGGFLAIDEGDYNALPQHLIDRIVHSVPGMMADDFDEANIARAASFMSVVMDAEWDDEIPF